MKLIQTMGNILIYNYLQVSVIAKMLLFICLSKNMIIV